MKTRSKTGSLPKPIQRFGDTVVTMRPVTQIDSPQWNAERRAEINALAEKRKAEFLAKAASWNFGPRRARKTLSQEQVTSLLDFTKRYVAKWGQLDQTYAEGAEDCDIIETGIKRFLAVKVKKIVIPQPPTQSWKEPDRFQTSAFVELNNGKQAQQICCLMLPVQPGDENTGFALQAHQAQTMPSLLLGNCLSENIQNEWIETTEEAESW